MRTRDKRLARVQDAVDAMPVARPVLRDAYECFRMFGELPHDEHVAFEVIEQALRGGREAPHGRLLGYRQRERPGDGWPPTVRGLLFDEALDRREPVRKMARTAIALEVALGGDVESPAFAARHGIPGYGSVALHVLGWPGRLAVPPYEAQARRLFVRLDNVRGRIPQDDPCWFDDQAEVQVRFWLTGELPDDDLHLDALLVNVELDLLQAHRRGEDVAAAMVLLNRLTFANADGRDELLDELSAMAATRRLIRDPGTAKAPAARHPARPTTPPAVR